MKCISTVFLRGQSMSKHCLYAAALLAAVVASSEAFAHGFGGWTFEALEWKHEHIARVASFERKGRTISVDGKQCVAADMLYFDVRDDYAFDINETVWLDLDFPSQSPSTELSVGYDSNGLSARQEKRIQLTAGATRQSIPLEHARFVNGFGGTDFSISGPASNAARQEITVCGLSIRRSYETPVSKTFGRVVIDVLDERGQRTPARMGIYDSAGRLPWPSDEAITHKHWIWGTIRVDTAHFGPWPTQNRQIFYMDGQYQTKLPPGDYEVVVAKGPEYRVARQRFTIEADHTKSIQIKSRRWTDMAAKGWYSGDPHIHYPRLGHHDDQTILTLSRAEDVRVVNILQFDNAARSYYLHYDWKQIVQPDHRASFVLAPGQEAPRTSLLGHTIQLNIKKPIRDTDNYLLYHKIFENTHAQGGITGYAHVSDEANMNFRVRRGLAIDVPLGLVDFAEVLMAGSIDGRIWFDFLNLGYKVAPSAGTDGGPFGTVRNYVQIDGTFTPQAWFDGLKKGNTFVTSGPMLEISVKGQGMGSELHVTRGTPLVIEAKASINPDFDTLNSLELIEQGEVVKTAPAGSGVAELKLRHDFSTRHGTWFVARARGKNPDVIALSAPLYVLVDKQSFWKPAAVPAIVKKMKADMLQAFDAQQLQVEGTEGFETKDVFEKYWKTQQAALKARVDKASAIYDDLAARAAASAK